MDKEIKEIVKNNGSKNNELIIHNSTKDEIEILTLEKAKNIAEYIATNSALSTQFGEKDEKGNTIINIPAIATCLMLGSEMGLQPMEALQFGKMLNRQAVIKVRKGRTMGLDPITSLQNIYIWNSNNSEQIYTGINIVIKVLNENDIDLNVIDDGTKPFYIYKLTKAELGFAEIDFDERDEFLNNKYTVINDGKSPKKLKEDLENDKIPLQRISTYRGLVELTRTLKNGKTSKVAIPYTKENAIEAGFYPGKNSFGETVDGKNNWINHLPSMLRKMSIMFGARIIANDKLNGIYEKDELGSVKIYTNSEVSKFRNSVVEDVESFDIEDTNKDIE